MSAQAATLFTSGSDANTRAFVFSGGTDDTSGSSSLNITDWTTDSAITSISGLTAISTTDGGATTQGGFAVTQGGSGSFANNDVVYLSRNHNLADPRTDAQLGYSFTFTLDSPFDLTSLAVESTHTTNTGTQDQAFASDLIINISGGTLSSPISRTINENYDGENGYQTINFDLTGNQLSAGDYTMEVYQSDMPGGGAYASYDGITPTADAVPEPSSTALLGLGGLTLILRRRK